MTNEELTAANESLVRENELLREQVKALRETISPDNILSKLDELGDSELLTPELKKKVDNLYFSITQFIAGEGSRKKMSKELDKKNQKLVDLEMKLTRMTIKLSRWQEFLSSAIEAKRELNRLKRKSAENG
jgi:Na+/phosphate symporter